VEYLKDKLEDEKGGDDHEEGSASEEEEEEDEIGDVQPKKKNIKA